jgi:hypothetical protein
MLCHAPAKCAEEKKCGYAPKSKDIHINVTVNTPPEADAATLLRDFRIVEPDGHQIPIVSFVPRRTYVVSNAHDFRSNVVGVNGKLYMTHATYGMLVNDLRQSSEAFNLTVQGGMRTLNGVDIEIVSDTVFEALKGKN